MDQSLQRSQIIQLTQGYQSQSGIWQLRKIDIIVQHNKMNELIYLQDGEILKKELLTDYSEEVNNNIEMIKYAFWNGQMNNQNHKFGRWNAFWKGKRTIIGGYYDQNNLKKGKWAEFFNKYWDRCQVIFIGEYYNGKKYGLWETLYRYQSREQYQIMQIMLIKIINLKWLAQLRQKWILIRKII
ncbi:unnamed protein product [Paramecium sonneborni]|uniref:Uncharacterized protein n=1 Tax=Paramecium sonneborni TaxID=65129 RepID=A0A8S1RQJ7_9CILI|nr:unnamed protein product [Paramecium sonneborni]